MEGFVAGAVAPVRALILLRRNPPLWRHVVVPIVVCLALAVVLYGVLLSIGFRVTENQVLRVLLAIGALLAAGFLVVRFGIVIGSPWYERLSEELEALLLGAPPPEKPLSIGRALGDIGRALGYEVRKLLLIVSIALPALLLNLLPGIGTLAAAAVSFGLGALLACLDFFQGPLERRRRSFGEKLAFIRATLPASAGFGLVCAALVAIPFVGLLSIPLCVTAGTMFACERLRDQPPDR